MGQKLFLAKRAGIEVEDNAIASGGEGSVYRVVKPAKFVGYCAKVYAAKNRTDGRKKKIEFMISNLPVNGVSGTHYKICWPLEMLFDDNQQFVGFIMPLAFSGSVDLYQLTTLQVSPKLNNASWQKFDRAQASGMEKRFGVCNNIAFAIDAVHKTGKYSLVDYKPQNVLITPAGEISVIDVDSMQISENGVVKYYSQVSTAEYAPPESATLIPSKRYIPPSWDRFSMAVSFYEILFGLHPFAGSCGGSFEKLTTTGEKILEGLYVHGSRRRYFTSVPPPHNNFHVVPEAIKILFNKTFEEGFKNPQVRPSPQEWGTTIMREIDSKSIKGCSVNVSPPQPQKKTQVQPSQGSKPVVTTTIARPRVKPRQTTRKPAKVNNLNFSPMSNPFGNILNRPRFAAPYTPPPRKKHLLWKFLGILIILALIFIWFASRS